MNANMKEEFYDEVAKALWNYLLDRFKIEKKELSFDNVEDTLKSNNIDSQTIERLITLLNSCEFVRFDVRAGVRLEPRADRRLGLRAGHHGALAHVQEQPDGLEAQPLHQGQLDLPCVRGSLRVVPWSLKQQAK